MDDHVPELLPPRTEPRLFLLPGIAAAGLIAAVALTLIGRGTAEFAASGPLAAGPSQGALAPIDASSPNTLTKAIRALRLDPQGKRKIEDEVLGGRMRLGVLTVWDWKDMDGDAVTITSAGFSQAVALANEPTPVVVPYRNPGDMIAVTGLRDGQNMITVGVSVDGQPTSLTPIYVGETIQICACTP